MFIKPRKSVLKLNAYKPNFGKKNSNQLIRLSANENPLGCSPKILNSINFSDIHKYPPQHSKDLIFEIANKYKLNKKKIILGNGSDELISIIAQSFLNFDDEAIYTEYGFLQYPQAIAVAGGKAVVAKDNDLTASVENIIKSISKFTRLIYLANPNNPTGTFLSKQTILKLVNNIPRHVILVYDAAYAEYMDEESYTNGINLVENHENVIMLRTFSKFHGLAGLRLGWAYCSEKIVKILMSVKGPFSVNSVAIKAGIIAIGDKNFHKRCFEYNKSNMKWMENELNKLSITYQKSFANFILIKFSGFKGVNALKAESFFSKNGILVRNMKVYNLPEYLRVSLGTINENKLFIKTLKKFVNNLQ